MEQKDTKSWKEFDERYPTVEAKLKAQEDAMKRDMAKEPTEQKPIKISEITISYMRKNVLSKAFDNEEIGLHLKVTPEDADQGAIPYLVQERLRTLQRLVDKNSSKDCIQITRTYEAKDQDNNPIPITEPKPLPIQDAMPGEKKKGETKTKDEATPKAQPPKEPSSSKQGSPLDTVDFINDPKPKPEVPKEEAKPLDAVQVAKDKIKTDKKNLKKELTIFDKRHELSEWFKANPKLQRIPTDLWHNTEFIDLVYARFIKNGITQWNIWLPKEIERFGGKGEPTSTIE